MENIAVPSRFSCLRIEDEEFQPFTSKLNKKKPDTKQINKKSATVVSNDTKKPATKQNAASHTSSKKNKSKGKQEDKQWQEWRRKDDELVTENFEQDMQCALLQSKLDFENQKKNSVSVIVTTQDKTKKKKTKTMSLDQFLENGNQNANKELENKTVETEEGNFFEKVTKSAEQEIKRERVEQRRRERSNNIEEVITLAQCQEKLEQEKIINKKLRNELELAQKEISVVRKRNKTLCNMLSQGEMKDKAAVLLELEKLTSVKEELMEEVTRLHKLLEQARSSTKSNSNPVSESQNPKHKDKSKKKRS